MSKPPSPPTEESPEAQRNETLANGFVNPFYLPPARDVNCLLETFFANTGRLFPYLYSTTILDLNNTTSRPVDPIHANRVHLCLLNMVMAFASIHSPSSSSSILEKLTQGDVYFQRGLYMLSGMRPMDATLESGIYLVHKPNIAINILLVQAMLLASQYVQGTQRSAQTWSIASSAIQGALQLGLWRQITVDGLGMGPLVAEVRRRTWWMCYMMDKSGHPLTRLLPQRPSRAFSNILERMCSMTFGRPPLIPNRYMECELPLDMPLEKLVRQPGGKAATSAAQAVSGERLYLETS
jgi:hypothetical protein